ncbi:MAG: hypothetical protein IKM92_07830, partial [Bacteroidaceae bacterium]|nr:hypothetical protein [Bacteroidaceae bacterium]
MSRRLSYTIAFFVTCFLCISVNAQTDVPPEIHPSLGTTAKSEDGQITLTLEGKRQNFGGTADTRDVAIYSP